MNAPPEASRKRGNEHHDSTDAKKNTNPDEDRTGTKQGYGPGTENNEGGHQTDSSRTENQNSGRDDKGQFDTQIPSFVESLLTK